MKKILGISAFYHDAAATLLINGVLVAAAQEERFTRKKNTADFPINAITYCLEEQGLTINDLDAIVFYDKPLLKFERLLETYYATAPRGLISFLKAIPIWLSDKLFLKKRIKQELKPLGTFDNKKTQLLFSNHHLSHAASTYFASNFDEAAILTIDGVGEWCTTAISIGKENKITTLKEMHFPHSLGLLYSAFTQYLGFKVNEGEYKVMGLAPYGNTDAAKVYKEKITTHLVSIKEDGSLWMNQKYFRYTTGLQMIQDKKWKQLFDVPKRLSSEKLNQEHCDIALALQQLTETIVLQMAKTAKELTGARNLCLAGGVALNCVANGKLIASNLFNDVFIQPAAGDAGGALGAAYAIHHMYYNAPKIKTIQVDAMQGTYLGPDYSNKEIEKLLRKYNAAYTYIENDQELFNQTAGYLAHGKVVGWFQGRMEFGPRALGNRSILADPRDGTMQHTLNMKIKKRESFRPFAPAVLAEDASQYFNTGALSPYMLTTTTIKEHRQIPVQKTEGNLNQRLAAIRSDIPAVTHLDHSARVQVVYEENNKRFWSLLKAFKHKTGCGVLVNTSFNVKDEPIVCSPKDAIQCFMNTDMDYLVLGNFLLDKGLQAEHSNNS